MGNLGWDFIKKKKKKNSTKTSPRFSWEEDGSNTSQTYKGSCTLTHS